MCGDDPGKTSPVRRARIRYIDIGAHWLFHKSSLQIGHCISRILSLIPNIPALELRQPGPVHSGAGNAGALPVKSQEPDS